MFVYIYVYTYIYVRIYVCVYFVCMYTYVYINTRTEKAKMPQVVNLGEKYKTVYCTVLANFL